MFTKLKIEQNVHLGRAHLFLKLPLRLLPLFPPTLPQVLNRLYLVVIRDNSEITISFEDTLKCESSFAI